MSGADSPELIAMLTQEDVTVSDALEVFRACKGIGVSAWGFKNVGLPPAELQRLGSEIADAGCTVYLEIVSLTSADVIAAIDVAVSCSCYAVMGSRYTADAHDAIRAHGLRYLPFVGEISSHPNVLDGHPDRIVEEVQTLAARGVDGIDLLTYRYRGDPDALLRRVTAASSLPVISAGSIASFERITNVWDAGAWGFTIGSALFDGAFEPGGSFRANLASVASWLREEKARRRQLDHGESAARE